MTTIRSLRSLRMFVLSSLMIGIALITNGQSNQATVTGWNIAVIASTGDPLTIPIVATLATTVAQTQSQGLCGKDPAPNPSTPILNPGMVEIDDPFSTTTPKKRCQLPMPSPIPAGDYRAVASSFGMCGAAVCTSARAVAPTGFTSAPQAPIQTPPAAPTNVRVKQLSPAI